MAKENRNTCAWCGDEITFGYKHRKYCSDKCKHDHWKAIRHGKRYPISHIGRNIDCDYCGKQFKTATSTAKFCSRICQKRAARRKDGPLACDERIYRNYDLLVEQNAKQAWRYWLKEKAPNWWLDRYYQATGKPWNDPRLSKADSYKLRYSLDIEFQINERMRRQLNKAKKRDHIGDVMRSAINRNGGSPLVERELGYSIKDLKQHIERQFVGRMSWDEYRNGNIHIDHIIPQSAYNLKDNSEWKSCWSLSNLMPLWAKDNLSKNNKILSLL